VIAAPDLVTGEKSAPIPQVKCINLALQGAGNDESELLALYSFNFRRRCASVRSRSALSRMKPSASR
jgi:hypothetical protein